MFSAGLRFRDYFLFEIAEIAKMLFLDVSSMCASFWNKSRVYKASIYAYLFWLLYCLVMNSVTNLVASLLLVVSVYTSSIASMRAFNFHMIAVVNTHSRRLGHVYRVLNFRVNAVVLVQFDSLFVAQWSAEKKECCFITHYKKESFVLAEGTLEIQKNICSQKLLLCERAARDDSVLPIFIKGGQS